MNKILLYTLFIVSTLIGFSSCSDDGEIKKVEPVDIPEFGTAYGRTVLVYMVAENRLSKYASEDVDSMLSGARYMGMNDHLIVYLDDRQYPRVYSITYWDRKKRLSQLEPVRTFDTDMDSCSPEVMQEFMDWAYGAYAAPSFGLVLWSHGSGWVPPMSSSKPGTTESWGARPVRSFGSDNLTNANVDGGSEMSIQTLRNVLTSYPKFDYIIMDACFMQNIELVYEMRNTARYIIGSPAELPADGAPYETMMKYMFSDDNYAEGMVDDYYKAYETIPHGYGVLVSAVCTDSIEQFAEFTEPYIKKYKEKLINMEYDTIQNYFKWDYYGMSNPYPDFYDMKGVMMSAMEDSVFNEWYPQYKKIIVKSHATATWYSDFNKSINNTVDFNQYSGISMHVPLWKYASRNKWFAPAYYATDWAMKVWNTPEDDVKIPQ